MKTLKQQIENLSDSDLMQVWQMVCDLFKLPDYHVYTNNEEFFNEIGRPEPIDVARSCACGNYHYQHEYVKFDGYGNLKSGDFLMDMVDIYQIEDCVNKYPDDFAEWFELEESEEEE